MLARKRIEVQLLVMMLVAGVLEISAASPSIAQDRTDKAAASPFIHAALTVEGGGTLGAYEGGLTWALLEMFRQRRVMGLPDSVRRQAAKPTHPFKTDSATLLGLPRLEFHAAAGASAGSINAFIAANRWCSIDPPQREDDSSFWRVWVLTGLAEVLPRRRDADWHAEKAVFTRSRFTPIFAKLDSAWDRASYDKGCKVLFGAAITRLASDSVEITERIHPRNQRYAAAFAVEAPQAGTGALQYRQPLADSDARLRLGALVQLPSDRRGGTIPHGYAHALLNASSGYPLAFQPQMVHYCAMTRVARSTRASIPCTEPVADSAYFVDGGVFDNGPLTLGYGMALTADPSVNLDNLNMLFVSPSQRRFTGGRHDAFSGGSGPPVSSSSTVSDPQPKDPEVASEGLDALAKLLRAFIPSARQYEMQVAARLLPVVQKADRQQGNSISALARAEAKETFERKRADFEYQTRRRDMIEAARAIDSVMFERDSLRYTLATCRLGLTPCSAVREDSLVELPKHHEVAEVNAPSLAQDSSLTHNADTQVPFEDLLYTSTRWHPLAGDWLFGFGGFIGRSLREYDFYVGVYDGLVLVAQQMVCRYPAPSECFPNTLSALITSPIVPLSRKGTTALKALYDEEFPLRGGADKLLSTADSAADPVTVNIIKAMGSRMSTTSLPANACRTGGRIERLSCADGIDTVFGILRNTPDFAHHGMSQECSAGSTGKLECTPDSRFTEFVENPSVAMNKLTGQVLERLLDATPDSSGLKFPLTVATATFFATNERTRTGIDAGSVSLPSLPMRKLLFFYALPSSVGGFAGVPGWYLEWATRAHVNSNFTLGVSGRLVWASGFKDSTTLHRGRIFIPAFRAEIKPWGRLSPWISTAGIDLAYWSDQSPYAFWRDWDNNGLTGAVTGALFAQRIRVSVYRRPRRYWIRSGDKPWPAVSIGLGDTSGALYWLLRSWN